MKNKSYMITVLLALILMVTLFMPKTVVSANGEKMENISEENEAVFYKISTKNNDDKQTAEIELTLTPKENIVLQGIVLPNGTEEKYENKPIKYIASENGTLIFTLKYGFIDSQNKTNTTYLERDQVTQEQINEILTVDISFEITNVIHQIEESIANYEINSSQIKTIQKDINVVQVSNFNELVDALANSNITIIELMQDIEVTDTLQVISQKSIIANKSVNLTREKNFSNTLINITTSGSLILNENLSIDGLLIELKNLSLESSAISVSGYIEMNGCSIKNNIAAWAPAISILAGGKAVINDCDISYNSIIDGLYADNGGGGIRVGSGGQLEMNGGNIHDNTAYMYGGGVCVVENGKFILNNGRIYNNKALHQSSLGGGIYAGRKSTFYMYDGEIFSNTAGHGGGIALGTAYDSEDQKGNFIFEKGFIHNNTAADAYGGGLYSPSKFNAIKLKNIYIGENSASYGGGLYDCPTGESKIYITNGGAFVDNTAEVAGNTLYKVDSENEFYISTRILGGGKQLIYNDFNPRYQLNDTPLEKTMFQNVDGQLLLHNEIDQEQSKNLARQQAQLIIENNNALVAGGGIANNGSLIIGDQDADKTLHVSKIWESPLSDIPSSILIDLIRIDGDGNELVLETVELSENNKWQYSFEELPGEFNWTVKEHEILGFVPNYETVENGNEISVKINNTVEKVNKVVTKVWEDSANQDGIRVAEVTVQLYADGKAVGESLVLNENNSWTAMWSDLAKYKDGKEILYTVE
ncbi:Cna B-type domain-containing protein, partial [Beduini massiliensis]